MMLFDRLNKAIEKVNPSYEEDSFIDVCTDPSEYGLDGAPKKVKEDACAVGVDPEDPSIYNSVSTHNDEVIEKRGQNKLNTEVIHIPTYDVKEEHVQEGDHVYTKRTELDPAADSSTGEKWEKYQGDTMTEAPTFSEPTCTSNVSHFLETYVDSSDAVQVLRYDLMKLLADAQWIKESGNQNEQFALDWVDAINELSCSF